jgi:hypothetical protein
MTLLVAFGMGWIHGESGILIAAIAFAVVNVAGLIGLAARRG